MNGDNQQTNRNEFIDEHLFVEALALAAFDVNYKEPAPSDIEKVSDMMMMMMCV